MTTRGFAEIAERLPDLTVTGEAATAREALQVADAHNVRRGFAGF